MTFNRGARKDLVYSLECPICYNNVIIRKHLCTLMIETDWINRAEQIRLRLTQLQDSL